MVRNIFVKREILLGEIVSICEEENLKEPADENTNRELTINFEFGGKLYKMKAYAKPFRLYKTADIVKIDVNKKEPQDSVLALEKWERCVGVVSFSLTTYAALLQMIHLMKENSFL